ncbi:MAG TPA: GDSL-type esterase/lipase family protein [Pseudolabrys sp.]|nr:GDSL-type esterase/lipase family protein [Pseudolabrys sp.]
MLKTAIAALAFSFAVNIAAARPLHIVAFGDSLTSGYLIPHKEAYPAQLEKALRRKGYDVTVKNAGLAGDTAHHALRRFDMAIDPGTDIAIVEFGINDRRAGASLAQVRARLAAILRVLRARRIQVLLIGAGGLDLAGVAKANGALYAQWKLPSHKFRARDGAHFNAQGYAILVRRMLPQVETLIARAMPR